MKEGKERRKNVLLPEPDRIKLSGFRQQSFAYFTVLIYDSYKNENKEKRNTNLAHQFIIMISSVLEALFEVHSRCDD
ncbi:CLUMA_CG009307, isoform A [Clunio marinus]|uniref:CLUMA_CG009307, isoform A n=1 Tax=Clunio marinus TaxID=568069 RepID=A0A1J1I8G1_9DIPT|nr:CLUMA_CG009307, isoform A [Clunio marinus]